MKILVCVLVTVFAQPQLPLSPSLDEINARYSCSVELAQCTGDSTLINTIQPQVYGKPVQSRIDVNSSRIATRNRENSIQSNKETLSAAWHKDCRVLVFSNEELEQRIEEGQLMHESLVDSASQVNQVRFLGNWSASRYDVVQVGSGSRIYR